MKGMLPFCKQNHVSFLWKGSVVLHGKEQIGASVLQQLWSFAAPLVFSLALILLQEKMGIFCDVLCTAQVMKSATPS